MKKQIKILSLTFIIGLFLLISCTVEKIGPTGPQGPPGEDGWSDIKIIDFDILFDRWLRDNSEPNYWYFIYKTSLVDWYVVDDGAVLFYYGYIENDGNVNKWYFIPFTNIYWDEAYQDYFEKIYDANYSHETLEITVRDTHPDYFDFPESYDIRIKALIMEGTYYNLLKQKDIDFKDYNNVRKALEDYQSTEMDMTK